MGHWKVLSKISWSACWSSTVGDFCGRWASCKFEEGTVAIISTVKCDDGHMYHLLVGICANGYPFSHMPTKKWYRTQIIYFFVFF